MSQDDLFGAPAGWYPDPLGLPQLRWWNNHAWTEQTSAARQPMVMQDTKFAWADDELPTRREERERERQRDDRETVNKARPTAETLRELEPPRAFTKISEPEPAAQAAPQQTAPAAPVADAFAATQPAQPTATVPPVSFYQPDPIFEAPAQVDTPVQAKPTLDSLFGTQPSTQHAPQPAAQQATLREASLDDLFGAKPTRAESLRRQTPIGTASAPGAVRGSNFSSTGPSWIIAMVPLFQLVLSLLVLTTFGMNSNVALLIGILIAPYFLVVGLALLDYRQLKNKGITRPAHWAWAFLSSPVYLLMRARAVIRESGHGLGPLLVWFGLGFLHIVSVIAIPGLLIAVAPAIFTPQIEQTIEDQARLISATEMSVTCPQTPPVLAGEQVKCAAINSNGKQFDILVRLERSNGWIAWQVVDWGVFTVG